MSETENWFSLGFSSNCDSAETFVRAWAPGDGVRCAHASYQKREACGPPVAVVEVQEFRFGTGGYKPEYGIRRKTTRVVCAEHLAGRVANINTRSQQSRSKAIARAVQKATDELTTKYWKQYQVLYKKHLDSEIGDLLSNVPEPLKQLVSDALDAAMESGDAA
ncbi:hypothetical protein [Mycolicibacterium fortuitum]|uniref:hypothetical protein n=1 Tax=Mycolicibacterium fortuitum TaxID=1766 RepID=UPI0007E971D2|nr:hypothetical protein [Mycolicibacterium fortuitum]OBB47637.1 hypothetical protein A5754_06420 [Mycolicibacterium fortuitum]OBB65056.1 hypothetical protein A5755_21010 [Mycolicibacterium fortuitum]OBF66005.1 hypothetical protein A5751_02985 [Mycolicibacterium fortuitum]